MTKQVNIQDRTYDRLVQQAKTEAKIPACIEKLLDLADQAKIELFKLEDWTKAVYAANDLPKPMNGRAMPDMENALGVDQEKRHQSRLKKTKKDKPPKKSKKVSPNRS